MWAEIERIHPVRSGECGDASAFAIRWALFVFLALATASPAIAQAPVKPPHAKVQRLSLQETRWTDGFWKDRIDTCHRSMIPAMWEIMQGTQYKPFLEHFRIAAGLAEGRHRGAKWNDGDFYKWMEGVCAMLAVRPDPAWNRRLDDIIDLIGKAQREDGYLHTPVLIGNEENLLGGMGLLKGNAVARGEGDWQGKLYRPLKPAAAKSVSVQFIPYFAWGNRGAGEMSVWLPLD